MEAIEIKIKNLLGINDHYFMFGKKYELHFDKLKRSFITISVFRYKW